MYAFTHQATPLNIIGNSTYIIDDGANSNPNAILLITHNWNPRGSGDLYHDHHTGVWFDGNQGKWAIFNQDLAAMTEGVAFNIQILSESGWTFVHYATVGNITGNYTYLDHWLTNNKPKAAVFVTANYNPGGSDSGVYNNHAIGVWYDGSVGKWAIFNQDLALMPIGAAFNVEILSTENDPSFSEHVVMHTADRLSIAGNYTHVSMLNGNDNPNAILFITPNYNPFGRGGIYNNHATGVWYDSNAGRWAVYNEDRAPMPDSVGFNVMA